MPVHCDLDDLTMEFIRILEPRASWVNIVGVHGFAYWAYVLDCCIGSSIPYYWVLGAMLLDLKVLVPEVCGWLMAD